MGMGIATALAKTLTQATKAAAVTPRAAAQKAKQLAAGPAGAAALGARQAATRAKPPTGAGY